MSENKSFWVKFSTDNPVQIHDNSNASSAACGDNRQIVMFNEPTG
jgi:hypothetical protein